MEIDRHSEAGIGSSAKGANSAAGVTITADTPKDFACEILVLK
jgi:hypothetical protein